MAAPTLRANEQRIGRDEAYVNPPVPPYDWTWIQRSAAGDGNSWSGGAGGKFTAVGSTHGPRVDKAFTVYQQKSQRQTLNENPSAVVKSTDRPCGRSDEPNVCHTGGGGPWLSEILESDKLPPAAPVVFPPCPTVAGIAADI
jgi:hypothetical protein